MKITVFTPDIFNPGIKIILEPIEIPDINNQLLKEINPETVCEILWEKKPKEYSTYYPFIWGYRKFKGKKRLSKNKLIDMLQDDFDFGIEFFDENSVWDWKRSRALYTIYLEPDLTFYKEIVGIIKSHVKFKNERIMNWKDCNDPSHIYRIFSLYWAQKIYESRSNNWTK